MTLDDIYVVIPNLNGEEHLQACVDSLKHQTKKHKIIVVDNGSTDSSLSVLKAYSDIHVIQKEQNTGFTGGVNTGIRYALDNGAQCVALLNNDAVARAGWLENLVVVLNKNSRVGIATSKIMLADKVHLDSTGDFATTWGVPFPRGRHEVDEGQYDDETEVFGASGGASLYRAEVLQEIGLFDDDYFAYLEDVDVSFRAQLAGWRVVYEPKAVVYHKLSATSDALGKNFAFYHFVKNFILLYARNMPLGLYVKYLPLFCLHFLRLALGSVKRGQVLTFLRAVGTAVRLHPQTVRERRKRKGLRKLSSSEIDAKLYHGLPPRPPELSDT